MRLRFRLGYLVSYLIIAIGIVLSIGNIDSNSIIIYVGIALFSSSGIFYFIKERKTDNSRQNWVSLSVYILILLGVILHFINDIDTKLVLLALGALINPIQKSYSQTIPKQNE
jgi:uncharacterized membrane protein HdeD (DUF308 family)